MTAQPFQPTLQATTDAQGNCRWELPGPGGVGYGFQCTLSVLAASSGGQFYAQINSGVKYGMWSGNQPFGPVTYAANQPLAIFGQGLLPNTTYELQVQGVLDLVENLDASLPTPTGTTSLFGSDEILDVDAITIGAGATIDYGYFPCTSWAGVRLGANLGVGTALTITLLWWNASLTKAFAQRTYTLGQNSGGFLSVVVPHMGDMLQIVVQNQTAGGSLFAMSATHTSSPIAMFGGDDYYAGAPTVAHGAGLVAVLEPLYIFGGPAKLFLDPGAIANNYVCSVQAFTGAGLGVALLVFATSDTALRSTHDLIVPAAPIIVFVQNTSGSSAQVAVALTYDLARVG